jgi:glycosidase
MNRYLAIVLLIFLFVAACKPKQTETQAPRVPHSEWSKNAVIYEVNLRQHTAEGNIASFMPHLTRLKTMGVDILWFMPIHPIGELNRKGSLGSYYAVKDYRAVNPEFGTFDEFRALVDSAHALGMKVILDWVANHSSWDNVWTKTNPDFYEKDSLGSFISPYDWTDVVSLNFDNALMRDSMISAMKFWVEEGDIDGYRCDVAGMVPNDFWTAARLALDSIKPVFMLAEDEDNVELTKAAFDMNYGWKFHHTMNSIAQGSETCEAFWKHWNWNDSVFADSVYRMQFITNHDENSWKGTEFSRLGDAVSAMATISFLVPGMPLIYSGQEAGLNKSLRFFDKDTVDWSNIQFGDFYTTLIKIKKENQPLWNGRFGAPMMRIENSHPAQILSFVRQEDGKSVVAVFNLSGTEVEGINLNSGMIAGEYKDAFTRQSEAIGQSMQLTLPAWGYRVWVK